MNKRFSVYLNSKIKKFNKIIYVESDKSISHRALMIASQCMGVSSIKGILESEDINNTINCLRALGVRILKKNKSYLVYGNGLGSFRKPSKKNLYCGNAGTLARLLSGLLATSNFKAILTGDSSLKKRPMKRIIDPLSKIGANFFPKEKTTLPLSIEGTNMPLAQKFEEKIGSAQIKSSILLASLNTPGITTVQAAPSRDHTENLLKYINADIKIKKLKKENLITLKGMKNLFSFDLEVFGDQSSCGPFVILTLLTPKSKLIIKNVNCNPTRLGFVKILKKMNAKIKITNLKKKYGEFVGNLVCKSSPNLKPINCPKKLVPFAIDEFPLLFILSSLIKGKSKWNGIAELRAKESDRIKIMEVGLKKIGIKTKSTKDSLTINGDPSIQIKKTLHIFPYNDHRIAMAFFCLKQLINGKVLIHDFECVKTSFPKFLMTMKKIGAKYEIQK